MAEFINDNINEDELQTAYNNYVLRFKPSSGTATKAIITGLGFDIEIYPFNNEFYFNAKPYLKALFNNNFEDTISMDVDRFNLETFIYLDPEIVKVVDINIEIKRTSNPQFLSKRVYLSRGVKNKFDNYNFSVSPPYTNFLQAPTVKYWVGYPFDISFQNRLNQDFKIVNQVNNSRTITIERYEGLRWIISSGQAPGNGEFANNFSTNPFIRRGLSQYTINDDLVIRIKTIQESSSCGVYIKWINEFGTYSYYLFDDRYFEEINSSQDAVVNNDFKNHEETISKELVVSRTSRRTLNVLAKQTNKVDRDILYSLGYSPKIWLYTADKFNKSEPTDWYEIQLGSHTFPVNIPNRKKIDIEYNFVLPENNIQSI